MPRNCYDVLGVPHDATAREIRGAYLRLARELHPDRQQAGSMAGSSSGASNAEPFQEVQHAYELLSDPFRRFAYDIFRIDVQSHGGTDGPLFCVLAGCCCCCGCVLWTFVVLAVIKASEPAPDSFWADFAGVPWGVLFTPLWIVDLLLLPIVVLALSPAQYDLLIAIEAAALVVFTVLLYLQVAASAATWLLVVSPLILRDMMKWLPQKALSRTAYPDDEDFHNWVPRFAYPTWLIFLALHLDHGTFAWWVVLAPLYILVTFSDPLRYKSLATFLFCTSAYVLAVSVLETQQVSLWLSVPLFVASFGFCCCLPQYDIRREEYTPLNTPHAPSTQFTHATSYRSAEYGGMDIEKGSSTGCSTARTKPPSDID